MEKRLSWWLIGVFMVTTLCWVGYVSAAGPVTLEVLNPLGVTEVKRVAPAPHVADLNNKRVLLFDNGKPQANVALARVKELLGKRFTSQEFKYFGPVGNVLALSKEQIAEIKEWKPNVVIGSHGD